MRPEYARALLLITALLWGALALVMGGTMYPAMAAWLLYVHASATRP